MDSSSTWTLMVWRGKTYPARRWHCHVFYFRIFIFIWYYYFIQCRLCASHHPCAGRPIRSGEVCKLIRTSSPLPGSCHYHWTSNCRWARNACLIPHNVLHNHCFFRIYVRCVQLLQWGSNTNGSLYCPLWADALSYSLYKTSVRKGINSMNLSMIKCSLFIFVFYSEAV